MKRRKTIQLSPELTKQPKRSVDDNTTKDDDEPHRKVTTTADCSSASKKSKKHHKSKRAHGDKKRKKKKRRRHSSDRNLPTTTKMVIDDKKAKKHLRSSQSCPSHLATFADIEASDILGDSCSSSSLSSVSLRSQEEDKPSDATDLQYLLKCAHHKGFAKDDSEEQNKYFSGSSTSDVDQSLLLPSQSSSPVLSSILRDTSKKCSDKRDLSSSLVDYSDSGSDSSFHSGMPQTSMTEVNSRLAHLRRSSSGTCYRSQSFPSPACHASWRFASRFPEDRFRVSAGSRFGWPVAPFVSTPNFTKSSPGTADKSPAIRYPDSPNWGPMHCQMRRKSFASPPEYDIDDYCKLEDGIGFVDSHCHLDFLFKRLDFKGSYKLYQELNRETFPDSYQGCVAVFCDPQTFGKPSVWERFKNEANVWFTFGCHPHMANQYNEQVEDQLLSALKDPKVVALGEIGLDYSPKNTCNRDTQKDVFKRQLKIATTFHYPLVIHSRDATEDTLQIMKDLVPKQYVIHRHCFTGNWSEASTWLDEFPNLYIGLTALVTYRTAKEVHEVARNIPLSRLLLETDTPYFLPRNVSREKRWSHPGMAIHVAAQIAALRLDDSIEDILKATRENTRKVYKI